MICELTYTGERLSAASCQQSGVIAGPDAAWSKSWTWAFEYDGDVLVGLTAREYSTVEGSGDLTTTDTWTFGGDAATMVSVLQEPEASRTKTTTSELEPDLVLVRHPFELHVRPSAGDALLAETVHDIIDDPPGGGYDTTTEHTFSFDGPPRPPGGMRTRTRDDGDVVRFSYDEQGRLLGDFGYDGDLIVDGPTASYVHDEHGNLLERVARGGSMTTFDYGCWDD